MSRVFYFLNTENKLGFNGRVYGISENELQNLYSKLLDDGCSPEDYIFESNYSDGAVPYWSIKHLINVA